MDGGLGAMTHGSGPRHSGTAVTGLDEPLAESAPLAWAEAPVRCYRDPATGQTCLWYHRVWQYLRWLGFIDSVGTNSDFLLETFEDVARSRNHPSVLVSGTADYAMLAHLRCGYARAGAVLEATVVDRCPTALLINHWYADRYAIALETACADVLEYSGRDRFDLICTHNFVSRFDAEARQRLVARWFELSKPGGVVVTTQRIRPREPRAISGFTEGEARDLADRVADAARPRAGELGVDPGELADAVYRYAIVKGAHVIRSTDEVAGIFERAGFEIVRCDEGAGLAERQRDRPSSAAGLDTYRMRLVARRR
jgi:hypothetical protein